MTQYEVMERVAKISSVSGDDEVAHGMEDDLYEEFVRYVALAGPSVLSEIAKKVLSTKELDFARWCA